MKRMKSLISIIIVISLLFTMTVAMVGCGAKDEKPAQNTEKKDISEPQKKSEAKKEDVKKEVFKLKLGHTQVLESHYGLMSKKFAELVEEKTNGQVIVTQYPSSQLGGEVQMIQAARSGSLDLLITAQAPVENVVKEWSIFDVPYLFDSVEEANKVLADKKIANTFLDMLPDYEMVGLGFMSVMERNIFGNVPIRKVEDIEGLKLRVLQAPGYVKGYEALGAAPTPMAYTEVYISLQQGVVDGASTSPDQFIMDKFVEVADYYNITKVNYLPAVLIMGKSTFDKLSPDLQQAVQEAADEACAYNRQIYKEHYDKSLKEAEERGVEIVKPDTSSFKQKAHAVLDDILKDMPKGKEFYELIQSAK